AAFGVVACALVLVLVLGEAAHRVERGTGAPRAQAPKGSRTISVAAGSAHDFDPPPGDGQEHHSEIPRAVDNDPATVWSTETYRDHTFTGTSGPKPGVGLYVDAHPSVDATSMLIQTPQPGWKAKIYAASGSQAPPTLDGW